MSAPGRTDIDRLPARGGDNVLFQLFRTLHAVRPLMAAAVDGTGVSPDEYGVLGAIGFAGRITPTELARLLGLAPTTISLYVARFVERGHVRRLPNPSDGRSYLLELTDEGREIVQTIAPRVRRAVDALRSASERPLREIFEALIDLEHAAKEAGGATA